ncbi:fimbrial protein [Ralstonia soli]|uniref:Fimbrial protein n=1 Tax=Ralstonia soli TaxID=2953896 RepID=A0ABT1AGP6_9RALS|nr:fimbrial protein [Ralstonia soli]MCO5397573.1 fimbrial protein [Ralstonia soli]
MRPPGGTTAYPNLGTITVNLPATISVPATLADGGTIAQATGVSAAADGVRYCIGTIYDPLTQEGRITRFTTATSLTSVYATNVTGVGIRIEATGGTAYPIAAFTTDARGAGYFMNGGRVASYTVTLIKTGPVRAGTITSGAIGSFWWDRAQVLQLSLGRNTAITAPAPTCTVGTTSVNIPLGDVAASSFANVGATSPISHPANISLSCANNPRVTMTLQGTQAPGGPDTTVALSGAGAAQGVGVQVLYNSTPMVVNSTTPTLVDVSAAASVTVPISARYYRTGAITAGRANASPTLRFDYN